MPQGQSRRDFVRSFVPRSPLPRLLGVELVDVQADRATLRMPYRPDLTTMGDVVHGGAIATLLDTAGVVGAWSDEIVPESYAGSTIGLSIAYTAAARGEDLTAIAEVIRRGRELCFVDVTVRGEGERVVAKGQVTARYG
jgi:uncharacterized protein (TIGR00369 family)